MLGAILFLQAGALVPLPVLTAGGSLKSDGKTLVLECEGKTVKTIRNPDDLRGEVRIANDTEALDYVRFLRLPGVWSMLFRDAVVEIRPQPVVFPIPRSLYSDLRIYTISGWDGVVSAKDWKRLGFSDPKVRKVGEDWRVERACLVRRGDAYLSGTLAERVSPDGRYASAVERAEVAPSGVRWTITRI